MTSRIGTWIIAVGGIVFLMGILVLPAALAQHADTSLLAVAACGTSVGSLIAALGMYLKARALGLPSTSGGSSGESKSPARKLRGGCDICHGDLPVIHCKVHQVHLCPDCLGQHYDFRSCTYIPSTRRPTKTGKGAAKARGA